MEEKFRGKKTVSEILEELEIDEDRLVEECERVREASTRWTEIAWGLQGIGELQGKEEWVKILVALIVGYHMGWHHGFQEAVIENLLRRARVIQ